MSRPPPGHGEIADEVTGQSLGRVEANEGSERSNKLFPRKKTKRREHSPVPVTARCTRRSLVACRRQLGNREKALEQPPKKSFLKPAYKT